MNNIHLSILGSAPFSNILTELEFNNILNPNTILNNKNKKILVKILFAENLKIKEVKNYLLQNEPIILFLNYKDYIKILEYFIKKIRKINLTENFDTNLIIKSFSIEFEEKIKLYNPLKFVNWIFLP